MPRDAVDECMCFTGCGVVVVARDGVHAAAGKRVRSLTLAASAVMEQRGHISLSGGQGKQRRSLLGPDRNQYLDLSSEADSGDAQEAQDKDDDDEAEERALMRARALAGSDDDDDPDSAQRGAGEADSEELRAAVEQRPGMGWGKSKHVFYQGDEDEVSSAEGERIEEAEARRLQAKRVASLQEADFAPAPEEERMPGRRKKAKGDAGVEQLVAQPHDEHAELDALLGDVRDKARVVREALQPLLDWVQQTRASEAHPSEATQAGLSFLEMRYHLMLSYCTNLLFYTLLKTQGVPVQDHPVVEQLVRLRVLMEKTRGIDEKLQPQVRRLLKTAVLGVDAVEQDAASARANLRAMLEDDEDGDNDGADQDAQPEAYVPPKRSAVFMEEDDRRAAKAERKARRDKERASRSGIMQMVQEEMGDGPEVRSSQLQVLEEDIRDAEDEERDQYERDHFVRLGKTKGKAKAGNKFVDDLRELDDFGDVARVFQSGGGGQGTTLSAMAKQLQTRQGQLVSEQGEAGSDVDQEEEVRERDQEADAAYERFVAEARAKKAARKGDSYEANPNAHRAVQEVSTDGKVGMCVLVLRFVDCLCVYSAASRTKWNPTAESRWVPRRTLPECVARTSSRRRFANAARWCPLRARRAGATAARPLASTRVLCAAPN